MNFPILELKSGRDRSTLNRHAWIFSGAVKTMPQTTEGDIVAVSDNKGKILGYGFFSLKSQITCRMFEFTDRENNFDSSYWLQKFKAAMRLRHTFINPESTNAFRLIHAEGDDFPGLIVDVYDHTAVMQILIKATANMINVITDCLRQLGYQHVYLKSKSSSQNIELTGLISGWLTSPPEGPIIGKENNCLFEIDPETGQKTGFFLDQRANREMVREFSKNKKVLNTFSYSAGFSVYALAAGAQEVHSVDISAAAVEIGNRNVTLNGFSAGHQSFVSDCFDYLKTCTDDYDIIILDPPAFAKNARAVPNAVRGYKELNLSAFKKIKSGGLIFTFSCSQNIDKLLFQKIVFGAAADAGRTVKIIRFLCQGEDHPINIYHPETEYLKGLLLYVE